MKIALIGDLHYPSVVINRPEVLKARDAFFEHLLTAFLQTEADFHISIGDLTNVGELSEFAYVFNKVQSCGERVRFIHVMGNHDTYTNAKAEVLAATGQEPYGLIEADEANLILLDTARETVTDWSGFMEDEQLAWLENAVRQHPDKPLLVFAHHPIYGTTARSQETMMSLHESVDLRSILNQHNGTGLYFNGHNHINSIVEEAGWYYVQTAAPLDMPAFRLITIQNGQVDVELVQLEDEKVKEWADIVSRHMPFYEPYAPAAGDEFSLSLSVRTKQGYSIVDEASR
ncbi:metallophosphoesterase [Paenibacillus sp. SYP-B3998]|uniref:Metallophosphoesterase n=1 Tax=Paenibacillus sp. SYP-B3998 TaxID=2678564 RepID=A0A6G3ZYU5_9BACL|nr:metallophosphoesterase [Paenibacillus sp. SYP-B3998]NEW07383.1 metallophosphoesterase [Paenibacillus sp. SYP-B3998]